MRQIVIDTETTGLETTQGHRIIEIGCVELIDRRFTGNNFHYYINPEREVEAEALAVHGITNEFLADKKCFAAICDDLLNYISGAELIAHNAEFDVGFINHEMQLAKPDCAALATLVTIFDTLALARKMFPGQRNTLDALCRRYKIDLSARKFHGALLDAQLLAEVYLQMTGGQVSLFAELETTAAHDNATATVIAANTRRGKLLVIEPTVEELALHQKIMEKICARAK